MSGRGSCLEEQFTSLNILIQLQLLHRLIIDFYIELKYNASSDSSSGIKLKNLIMIMARIKVVLIRAADVIPVQIYHERRVLKYTQQPIKLGCMAC